MLETLFLMKIPALSAHLTDAKLMYSDNKNDGLSGQMDVSKAFRASEWPTRRAFWEGEEGLLGGSQGPHEEATRML